MRTRQDQDSQAEPPTCWHHIIESRDPKIKKRRLQPVAVLERRGRRKTFAVLGIPKDELIIQKKMILPQQSLRYHNGKSKKLLAAVKWGLGRCRGFFWRSCFAHLCKFHLHKIAMTSKVTYFIFALLIMVIRLHFKHLGHNIVKKKIKINLSSHKP